MAEFILSRAAASTNHTLVSSEKKSDLGLSWPWWRWALIGLSALGLGLSSYLGWHSLAGGSVIGCAPGSSCDQVLNSRWSSVGGILPVSGLAAGVYLAILVASFFIGPATPPAERRFAWNAILVLVGAIAGSAIWFIVVQKFFIGEFCPYCMATHITGLLLALLAISQALRQFANLRQVRRMAFISPTIGLALAGALAASQLAFTPPAAYSAGESQISLSAVDTRSGPLIGSPDAPYVVTLLFDYKCSHCQQLHFLLPEVVRRYGGKLAFALSPTPLNPQCNPFVTRDVDEFKGSCELAKIGLAVWLANHDAFAAFDNWMFSLESGDRWQPRSFEAARAKAIELVGEAKFEAALADPWIEKYLQASIRTYGDTARGGNAAIPKLVFGSRWVVPQPDNADNLVLMLHDSLAVPEP